MDWYQLIATNHFFEFTAILTLGALLGAFGQLLRQPLIVMFIALGILAGPAVLDIVKSTDKIHLLAEIGIVILLFIVGLKLDIRIIKSVGKIALLTGLGQVLFTSLIGYLIALLLGFSSLHSFYIAVALTFSSTIIIVKLLSDKKEIDSLHGQIAIGFLIVQDMVVILLMIVLSTMQKETSTSLLENIFSTVFAGIGLLAFTLFAMKFILPKLSHLLAKSQEMLLLFSIAWAVLLSSIAQFIGFSGEVGAFLAGISLASSEYKEVISSRLVSLRDFLLLFFFVSLGSQLDLAIIDEQIGAALIFSLFVLIGNPIIVLIIMGMLGYRKRTAFLAGLTVAQISEFSLIFASLALAVGHITEAVVGLITLVGLITIGLSTYMILYSNQIYSFISPALSIFERKQIDAIEDTQTTCDDVDIIILGLGRFGEQLASSFEKHPDICYLAIDFDPKIIRRWKRLGKNVKYGDMTDPELLSHIPFKNSSCIINTLGDIEQALAIKDALKRENYQGNYIVTVLTEKHKQAMLDAGLKHVLYLHELAALKFYQSFKKQQPRQSI